MRLMRPFLKSHVLLRIMVLIGIISLIRPAGAKIYCVATTGNDGNAGTLSSPFRTVNRGCRALGAGDTLIVSPGVYDEYLDKLTIADGTAEAFTTVRGLSNTQRFTMCPTDTGHYGTCLVYRKGQHHIKFQFMNIDMSKHQGWLYNAVRAETEAYDITLEDCDLKGRKPPGSWIDPDAAETGAAINNTSTTGPNFIIRRVTMHDWGYRGDGPGVHGMYWKCSDGLIEGCEIWNCAGFGCQLYSGSAAATHRNIFRNNFVHDNRATGLYIATGQDNYAFNNIITRCNGYGGIALRNSNYVYNNTVYDNSAGIHISGASGSTVRNNIFFGNRTNISGTLPEASSHNLTTDPRFVDTAGGDFHLQSTSPAINAGITIAEVLTDFAGITRPQDNAYDIGAYEYVSDATGVQPSFPHGLLAPAGFSSSQMRIYDVQGRMFGPYRAVDGSIAPQRNNFKTMGVYFVLIRPEQGRGERQIQKVTAMIRLRSWDIQCRRPQ